MNVKGIMEGNTNWVVKEDVDENVNDSISIEDSMNSICSSSSSSELDDQEASSSPSSLSSSSSSQSNGPLYELSELMNHLPLKRGLSMFYQGKAQSFSSLGRVQSIEDLAKKERPNYRKKVKSCKILYSTPKATISKKTSRGPCASLITRRGTFLGGSRPSFSVHKNF
ncbi:protein OXIDATIVE STRESS 3-like [Cicer arietinum]|uniref:Uncharacterized protein LOC101490283 n=1 Tax=Cicer arietinum TaxID=3827 RepID=A0A1S2Z915_CICAR|nr:uncharacterized protein LOC101515256 [Cicer arietinum]XP_004517211.1 uncharacterized protein LOC101490283 [Cicer arietinum]